MLISRNRVVTDKEPRVYCRCERNMQETAYVAEAEIHHEHKDHQSWPYAADPAEKEFDEWKSLNEKNFGHKPATQRKKHSNAEGAKVEVCCSEMVADWRQEVPEQDRDNGCPTPAVQIADTAPPVLSRGMIYYLTRGSHLGGLHEIPRQFLRIKDRAVICCSPTNKPKATNYDASELYKDFIVI